MRSCGRRCAALDPPPVLEGESRVSVDRIDDHQVSWAQWFADTPVPGVLRAHWYERRHMMHHTRRWNRDHSDELQSALDERHRHRGVGRRVRRLGRLERARRVDPAHDAPRAAGARRRAADGEWTPLADGPRPPLAAGVYVSRFWTPDVTLWTVVNRGLGDYCGPVIDPDAVATACDRSTCSTGAGPRADRRRPVGDGAGRGVTAIAAVVGAVPGAGSPRASTPPRPTATRRTPPSRRAPTSGSRRPRRRAPRPGDAIVVAGGTHRLVDHVPSPRDRPVRRCAVRRGVEAAAATLARHRRRREIVVAGAAAPSRPRGDQRRVRRFLAATGYRPPVANRFLRRWVEGEPPAAAHRPVTWSASPTPAPTPPGSAPGCRPSTNGSSPPRPRCSVRAADPAGVELDRERAQRRRHPLRHPQGRGGAPRRRRRTGTSTAGRSRPTFAAKLLLAGLGVERSPVDRLPAGLGPAIARTAGRDRERRRAAARRPARPRRGDAVRRPAGRDAPRRLRRRRDQDRAPAPSPTPRAATVRPRTASPCGGRRSAATSARSRSTCPPATAQDAARRAGCATPTCSIENFRPGTLERWGLGPTRLLEPQPAAGHRPRHRLRADRSVRRRPGFGTLAEAMSGFAAITGEPDGPPTLPPFGLADGIAALATAFAIMTALRRARRDRARARSSTWRSSSRS